LVALVHPAQALLELVHFVESELRLAKVSDACKDIRHPAARFGRYVSKKREGVPGLTDTLRTDLDSIFHHVNFGIRREAREKDVTAQPTCPLRRRPERRTFLDHRWREEVTWYEKQIPHNPLYGMVMKQEEARRVGGLNASNHRLVRRIQDSLTERMGLTLQLKRFATARAVKINHLGARPGGFECVRTA
jgi:hypothetical protein